MYNPDVMFCKFRQGALLNGTKEKVMKSKMVCLLAALSLAVLVAGGCANKESVKSEEAMVPKAAPAAVEVAAPAPIPEPAKPVEAIAPAVPPMSQQAAKASVAEAEAELSFETIYFDYDKSDLRQDARDVLSKNAEIMLKSKPDAKVQIEGHCDERGSAEYNLALGERRAKSSMQYLITLGVKADRLSVISYGKEKYAVQGSDEAAWSKNRRDEFVIVK
jgi:peptidoglycan-associated lipoprotein